LESVDLPAFRVLADEFGYLFARPSWMNSIPSSAFGIFTEEGRLLGGFLLWEQTVFGLRILRTPPFHASIGPFLVPELMESGLKSRDRHRKVLEELASFLLSRHPALISVTLDHRHQDMLAFLWRGCKVSPGLTYLLDLRQSEAALHTGQSAQRRQQLRRSEKAGVAITVDQSLEAVQRLVGVTFGRQGKALPPNLLEGLFRELRQEENWYVVRGQVEGCDASASLFVHSRHTAYHLFGGYDPRLRSTQAGAAVMWQAILHAKAIGMQTFDFEGSMLPAVERFYSDFGGEPRHPFRITRGFWPIECLLKIKFRHLF
jgi:hypothetical protein